MLNVTNIGLEVTFAGFFGWGAGDIAAGTVLAELVALVYAAVLVFAILRERWRDRGAF